MKISLYWPGVAKYLIALALGWFVFSVLLGLFFAFDAMEASAEITPSLAIPYFLKAAVVTFLIGLIVLSTPLLIWKLIRNQN